MNSLAIKLFGIDARDWLKLKIEMDKRTMTATQFVEYVRRLERTLKCERS